MGKRITAIYCLITLLMTGAVFRIYYVGASDYLTAAATTQGNYRLQVAQARGTIYDRNFESLLNTDYQYLAAVLPTPQSATVLMERAEDDEREALLERLSAARPFVLQVPDQNLYADGIDVFRVPLRYNDVVQIAPHLVGYLTGDGGVGAAGIEKAYDVFLRAQGTSISASYQMDAAGRALEGSTANIQRTEGDSSGGVVLTLDRDLQLLVQQALEAGTDRGAAVVMDVATGDILAMASIPVYDQNNIAASLESEDAPFLNRAISGYNIGSVFKLVVSAAALENNISRYHEYECQGLIDINGQVFRCNNHAVHGVINMERALEVSCNTYFIHLAQMIEPEYLLALCEHLGLGTATELAPEFFAQSGNLPTVRELQSPAALANFSFGQGSSLASPLQMAQVVSSIACGGLGVRPRLVLGTTADGHSFLEQTPTYATNRILSESTAATLRELMISVIEDGSGRPARPVVGGAGGKTSSAQTGQYYAHESEDEEEREIVHAWFAGFYPAQQPRYSVVVFVEGGESGERVAAPIFKHIADGIAELTA